MTDIRMRRALLNIIALQDGYKGEDVGRMRGYHVAGNLAREALRMPEKAFDGPIPAAPAPSPQMIGNEALIKEAIDAVWKCSLIIESSVRRGDGPMQYAEVLYALKLVKEVRAGFNAEKTKERKQVEDETEILKRLAAGDTIVFSMDGDMAWFTKGDRAFVGDAIMSLRQKGYLLRKRDVVDDADDPRGIAFYDTISDAGRAHLAANTEGQP